MIESGETRTNWFDGKEIQLPVYKFPTKVIQIPITLDSPEKYYKFKSDYANSDVEKVMNKPRDLKPASYTWTEMEKHVISSDNGDTIVEFPRTKNAFDTDPVRLRLNPVKSEYELAFIKAVELKFNGEFKLISPRWNQRNLQLLAKNRVMRSLSEFEADGISPDQAVNLIFGEDDLTKTFVNVENHYMSDQISKPISNYVSKPAEIIMGNMYKTVLDMDVNDSIADIEEDPIGYFRNKLKTKYAIDNLDQEYDMVVTNRKHNTNLYINFADDSIAPGEELPETDTVRLGKQITAGIVKDDDGNILFEIPSTLKGRVVVTYKDGQPIVNIRAFRTDRGTNRKYEIKGFQKTLKELLQHNKQLIGAVLPIDKKVNGKNIKINRSTVDKDGNRGFEEIYLQSISLNAINTISKTKIKEEVTKTWSIKNAIEELIEDLAEKQAASWDKIQEVIAARIPSQSMQSFMPMRNVAYFNTTSNDAYVSVYQIWFQGSDFDIDKAYVIGSALDSDGKLDTSSVFNYNSKSELDVIETMPLPTGNKIELKPEGLDITEDVMKFNLEIGNNPELDHLSENKLKIISDLLWKLKNTNSKSVTFNAANALIKGHGDRLVSILNQYNTDETINTSTNWVKNSIASTLRTIISRPENQLLATSPVDEAMAKLRNAADRNAKPMNLSPMNPISAYKQQYEAAVGKDDVGIAANGLKAYFALSSYYNNFYMNPKSNVVNKDNFKLFSKTFNIIQNGTLVEHKRASVSDVYLTDTQMGELIKILGMNASDFKNVNAADYLSGFTSAATD